MTRAARLALLVVATLAWSSCSAEEPPPPSDPTAAATTPAAPAPAPLPPAAPAVGSCYRLSYAEALAPTSSETSVGCDRAHTSQTFAVGTLDLLANGHLLGVDSDAARQHASRACPRRLADHLGATEQQLRLSLLRPVWFTPTIEESDLGAAWYRCDVIAVTGDRRLATFTGDLAGALGRPAGRAAYAMCGTAQPGTPAFRRVLCRDDHTWRAVSVVELADRAAGRGYPGEQVVREAGQDVCADAVREIASDALDYEWGYEWPTRDQWGAGQTFGRCWSPDPA